ncbi:class II fructose-bisphosphate aldolase [Kitasatospora kifunensis]|uniref:Fructose-bisphosphate aldolase class II n=1 Tax=Kitasatospora kifunensis TaxID=58351 RepID=A0A7W7VV92_KITKI|nr:class II fructose-bisphosphate aldolase [Kitasatospora kifunensis]MBB4924147.1 fructose-bisphosphate aldolase class II [Kitasatospora kifunensis]
MPLARTADLLAEAVEARRGLPAFNVITLEHAEAIAAGAELAGTPVVLQISQNAVAYHGGRLLPLARACAEVAEAARVPTALHLDHVEDVELLRAAPGAGFSSAMFDASHLSHADNLQATAEAADFAHWHGLHLEAELGRVGGKDGAPPLPAHAPGARTDPQEAADFVAATGVDALAVAVGSSHAMTSRTATLDHELIARLAAAVPVPLVLHGSSGVPDEELAAAVTAGLVKINIGTALNSAFTPAVRAALAAKPDAVDPRGYLARGREAMAGVVAHLALLVASLPADGRRTAEPRSGIPEQGSAALREQGSTATPVRQEAEGEAAPGAVG